MARTISALGEHLPLHFASRFRTPEGRCGVTACNSVVVLVRNTDDPAFFQEQRTLNPDDVCQRCATRLDAFGAAIAELLRVSP